MTIFPHCDPKVLHAPGECFYCDEHKDWQELRVAWSISFTGHAPTSEQVIPCPSEAFRPVDLIYRWPGNRPQPEIK